MFSAQLILDMNSILLCNWYIFSALGSEPWSHINSILNYIIIAMSQFVA